MKRLLLLLVLLPAVAGASTLEVRIEPNPARLGEPVRIDCALPPGSWQLPGLPDFGDLALLSAPRIDDSRLMLELLPLRPGSARLPELTLTDGPRALRTPETSLAIVDPVPEDAEPAGRLNWSPPAPAKWLMIGLVLATLLASLAALVAWRQRARDHFGFPELERRLLARLPAGPERDRLARELEIWLYSPYRPKNGELQAWRQRARRLEAGR